jgi:hypothetical protein
MLFRTRKEAAFGELFVLKYWDNAMPIADGDVLGVAGSRGNLGPLPSVMTSMGTDKSTERHE